MRCRIHARPFRRNAIVQLFLFFFSTKCPVYNSNFIYTCMYVFGLRSFGDISQRLVLCEHGRKVCPEQFDLKCSLNIDTKCVILKGFSASLKRVCTIKFAV